MHTSFIQLGLLSRILICPAIILSTKNRGYGTPQGQHTVVTQTLTPFSHGVKDYIWTSFQTVIRLHAWTYWMVAQNIFTQLFF